MDRTTEIELLEELAGLREARSFYLDDAVTAWPVARYTCPDRFAREMQALFRTMPAVAAHSSELAGPDAFLTRDHAGLPLLLTRDRAGAVHAFLNVCRHRGTRLVGAASGCRRRFTCPYHAWTYDNRGALTGVTHGRAGFPGIDRAELGLRRLGCTEAHGWIWIAPGTGAAPDIDGFLGGLAGDFAWFGADGLRIVHEERREWAANWKILYEGGLESYHFRIAHKDTIGPFFQDNLSSYRMFGRHIRSILPRARLDAEMALPAESRSLRRATNLVYSILPSSQLLVQEDHIVWIQALPTAPDRTSCAHGDPGAGGRRYRRPGNRTALAQESRHHGAHPGGRLRDRREHPERPRLRRQRGPAFRPLRRRPRPLQPGRGGGTGGGNLTGLRVSGVDPQRSLV